MAALGGPCDNSGRMAVSRTVSSQGEQSDSTALVEPFGVKG